MPSTRSASVACILLAISAFHVSSGAAAYAHSYKSTCLNTRSLAIARSSHCATDTVYLNSCLLTLTDGFDRSVLETCFANAGCSSAEAAAEAIRALEACAKGHGIFVDEENDAPVGELDNEIELRRRQNTLTVGNNEGNTAAQSAPPAANTGAANGRTTAAAAPPAAATTQARAQTTAAPAAQRTTVVVAQQTTDEAPSSTNEGVVFVTATAGDSESTSPANAITTTPLICLTTTTVSTTVCPISTEGPNAGRRGPCVSTTIEYPTCASGLLCRADAAGNPTCLRKINRLDAAGVIIAIVFAVAIATAVAGVCFLCCRERRQQRKLRAKMEAAAIVAAQQSASRYKHGPGARSVTPSGQTDRTPLMMAPAQIQGHQEYPENPFSDGRR